MRRVSKKYFRAPVIRGNVKTLVVPDHSGTKKKKMTKCDSAK